MNDRRHRDARQRPVDRLHRIAFCKLRIVAHPGLVELDNVGAGLLQVECFGVDGVRKRHRQLFVVLIKFVLGLRLMVNGPGRVIFATRSVLRRRNSMSRNSTGCARRTAPTTRGTGALWPDCEVIIAGLSISMPSSAVANRFE